MNTTTLTRTFSFVFAPAGAGADYVLPAVSDRALARGWLWLALFALVGSGLFSVLLVLARTPGVNAWLPAGDFFRTALVVHVDLSVLVWFVAIAGLLWNVNGAPGRGRAWNEFALALCGAGTALMIVAPFTGPVLGGAPVMANYVPLLDGPVFLTALATFGLGAAVLIARALVHAPRIGPRVDGQAALRFGLNAAAVAGAVALLAFAWSLVVVPRTLPDKTYYEILFWGGGHALQFVWTLLMLVGWLALACACGARVPLTPRVALLLFMLALVSVFVTPVAYLAHHVVTVEHRAWHTWAMRFGGGVAIVPVALAVMVALALSRRPLAPVQRPLRAALLASMLLFASGGVIGLTIGGANVKIPAHYHGCIVGVTLALMGLVFHLLPRLGYGAPQGRLAVAQPWVYGAGQLMHIVGLVWSGGYGVQRKVAGAEQVLRSTGEIAGMGLMGAGGLLAIVGGLLFVVVVAGAVRRR
ncbi:MAG TPA: cbb3-type cytochrome c oxidase subunit I [Burkholderiaceae bacterium]|nr:cbb3-type cytochrome c oxidase subunit I [Burkholderiaceae bacterium]